MKMRVFAVHFKDKKSNNYEAYSFTQKEGKYFFHKSPNKDDFVSFALACEVKGIEDLGEITETPEIRVNIQTPYNFPDNMM